ncbi:LacI family DNA-binding transcriptional regulator [Inquilinus limosus]|uniref:LacI family DNA-binding transcriptional regulator n=1 Tax=Inquilinus limosus TaxID=171674 RepID=UPI0006854DBB|nr:LacI family DNA-binding transcriptional regulator [Inquilinus limosus]
MADRSKTSPVNVFPARRPTIRDVAARAAVSIGTVSRVAGGSARVAEATRARVLAAMAETGYQPNAAARTMRTSRTRTIGFLIPDMANPVFSRVAIGAEPVLSAAGYMLFAVSSNRSPAREIAFLEAAQQRQMDGLIVTLADETHAPVVERLGRIGVPLVILDRDVPVAADVVYSDHARPIETLVRQMAAQGHKRIALITASEKIRPGRARAEAFRKAIAEAGLPVEERLIRSRAQTADYGAAEAHDLLTGPTPPTALIAGGNEIFQGALRAIRLLGLSVPQDLSLAGADDRVLAELVDPPITVIDRDMAEVGATAARMLLERLDGLDAPPRRVLLGSSVVLHGSIGRPKGRSR